MTITEALAELKTIQKRVQKKREFILSYLARQDGLRDPLEKDGGSAKMIQQERQAIADLEKRHVAIRTAIQRVNHATVIKIDDVVKTLADWLTWRKEVAPEQQRFIGQVRQAILSARHQAQQKGYGVVSAVAMTTENKPTDILINVDEAELAREAEKLEDILGSLDGQLSLRNATVTIEM